MKLLAIKFNPKMREAIQNGWKTQTRRVINPQPETIESENGVYYPNRKNWEFGMALNGQSVKLQESWEQSGFTQCQYGKPGDYLLIDGVPFQITAIRVERLQDISATDIVAEGLPDLSAAGLGATEHFAQFERLWESIKGPGSWHENPWVWVIDFKKLER